ncbi:MAG TPA: signal recognition particle protein, partial [Kiritimatiellia bacterium]
EPFYPDRMASRILGMGDVVSFVEKAQAVIDQDEMMAMQEKLMKDGFTLDDFLVQLRQMKKMGPLEDLIGMLPGAANLPAHVKGKMGSSEKDMKKTEAIVLSMTPYERRHPSNIDASRKRRIAKGSGVEVRDVNELLKKFEMSQQMVKNMKKHQKRLLKMGR